LKGERGLFLTLTYNRQDFESPLDLYRRQSEEQHVPMFLRRLARALDVESFAGCWMRKMEFQRGGWVHFHVVLLWPERIPHDVLTECWGHGFVWVSKLDPDKHAAYVSKYVAKGGNMPPWLYNEKPRSVKIVAASPGFWNDTERREHYDREPDPWAGLPVWKPIGRSIDEGSSIVVARDTETGHYEQIECDLGTLLDALRRNGCRVVEGTHGWVGVACRFDDLWRALGEGAARRQPGRPPLYSIRSRNPDSDGPAEYPRWLTAMLIDDSDEWDGEGGECVGAVGDAAGWM